MPFCFVVLRSHWWMFGVVTVHVDKFSYFYGWFVFSFNAVLRFTFKCFLRCLTNFGINCGKIWRHSCSPDDELKLGFALKTDLWLVFTIVHTSVCDLLNLNVASKLCHKRNYKTITTKNITWRLVRTKCDATNCLQVGTEGLGTERSARLCFPPEGVPFLQRIPVKLYSTLVANKTHGVASVWVL